MPVASKHLNDLLKKRIENVVLLARWPNNQLYYIATLTKFDPKTKQISIKYEDGQVETAMREDLHLQFTSAKSPYSSVYDVVCCQCEGAHSEPPNEIVLCDTCQQGYHRQCHKPNINSTEDDEWTCTTCDYIMNQSNRPPTQSTSTPKVKLAHKNRSKPSKGKKALAAVAVPVEEQMEVESSGNANETRDVVASDDINLPAADTSSSSEESSSNEQQVQQVANGTTVEKMQPVLIDVAKALIEKEANVVKTEDFVEAILQEEPNKPTKSSQQAPVHSTIEAPKENGTVQKPKKATISKSAVQPSKLAPTKPSGKIPRKAPAARAA